MKNSRSFSMAKFSAALAFLLLCFGFNSASASELNQTTSNNNAVEMMQGVSESNSFDKGKKTKKKKKKRGHRCEAMGG